MYPTSSANHSPFSIFCLSAFRFFVSTRMCFSDDCVRVCVLKMCCVSVLGMLLCVCVWMCVLGRRGWGCGRESGRPPPS